MNRTPLILAIALLLLPVLYVGSYFALVVPEGKWTAGEMGHVSAAAYYHAHYRVLPKLSAQVFWPLEQIDRKVRPGAWRPREFLPVP